MSLPSVLRGGLAVLPHRPRESIIARLGPSFKSPSD